MTASSSLLILKVAFLGGMTMWLAMVSYNNLASFSSGAASIGRMMSMAPSDEFPKNDLPLSFRRVTSPNWHKLTYALLLVIELAAVVLLANATLRLLFALGDPSLVESALVHANLALAGMLIFNFVMLLGGTWFAYYIQQNSHMITHLVLIVITLAGGIIVNLRS